MSKIFGQASHLLRLADEANMTPERFEVLSRSGILADVLGTADPSVVDRDSLRKVLAGLRVEVVTKKPLLSSLRRENIPALSAVTTSIGYFERAEVVSTGDNFKHEFLGLKVKAVKATSLTVHKLGVVSTDVLILQELGDKAEITPSQFKKFLSKNRKSKEQFIFYMKGKSGELRVVYAYWVVGLERDGWDLYTHSIGALRERNVGSQVVSLN